MSKLLTGYVYKSIAYRFSLVFQDLAHGLAELLSYEGNVEEDFCTTFQVGKTHKFLFTLTLVKHNIFDFTIINTVAAQGKRSTKCDDHYRCRRKN